MTYDSLVNTIRIWANKSDTDFISQIPTFIGNAEQAICNEDKNLGLKKFVNGIFTVGVAVYPKPARWRRNLSFNYGSGVGFNTSQVLEEAKYEYLRLYWPNAAQTSTPKFFADYDYQNLLIAPTPDVAYPFQFSYLELPAPLSQENQTNWITNYAPQILLYASMLETAPYLQDDERVATWKTAYKEGMDKLKEQNELRVTGEKDI